MRSLLGRAALSIFAVLVPLSLWAQEALPEHNRMMIESEPYWHGVILLSIGAVIGLIAQLAFELFRSWRRPRQQLSYEVAMESIIAGLPQEIRKDVNVEFRGRPIDNLYRIQCIIRNVERATVRDYQIRMRLGTSGRILDFTSEDRLLLEYDGNIIDDVHSNGRIAYVKYFPVRGEVKFLFIAEGDRPHLVVSEVSQTDIEFREISRRQLEREADVLRRIVSIVLLWMILPGISGVIPIAFLAAPVSGIIYIGLLVALFPVLRPASQSPSGIMP